MATYGADVSLECGFGACRPTKFQRFNRVQWFTAFYSVTGLVTSSLSMYINSQITTIEKQFGLSSTKSGYLMACNDIGYSIFILLASYLATRAYIPRFLCISTMLYGISGIVCAIPHFIFEHESPTHTNSSGSYSTMSKIPGLCTIEQPSAIPMSKSNITSGPSFGLPVGDDAAATRGAVAMTFIAIGMSIQGLAKAPRSPMLAQYVDDNSKKTDTGFYMGIIMTVSMFGPVLAYGLGALFSQTYVTLEDVELHPRDPRWIGAWWLGFLVFGVSALVFALPLACFPRKLRMSSAPVVKSRTPETPEQTVKWSCGKICQEIMGVSRSVVRVLKTVPYTLMLVGCIFMMTGAAAGFSFGPKYIEVQFNVPAWQSNIALGGLLLLSASVGVFSGGLLTKKVQFSPRSSILLILITQLPSMALQFLLLFVNCDQPTIENWPQQSSEYLPRSCSSDCDCGPRFMPVCDVTGKNYFSPCHAGCTGGSLYKFANCTCVPGEEVSTGLCKTDCNQFWVFLGITFISNIMGTVLMMPVFLFNIRIVKSDLKSMAVGIFSLCSSLFGWLPGPVIGGKLVDDACLLWSGPEDTGSCTFYDLTRLRYNLIGLGVSTKAVCLVLIACILFFTWNMRKWPGLPVDEDAEKENNVKMKQFRSAEKNEPLLKKCTFEDSVK